MKIDLTDLLYALSTALDIVEHEMIGVQSVHGKHVGYLSMLMARAHGMTGAALSDFVGTAVLHDNAFSEYVREEFGGGSVVAEEELLRRAKLLTAVRGLEKIAGWASHHHEKLGGTGYPLGLTHKELCFEDRLMTCVDIYQALTEERPYKTAMSHQKAIDILRDMAARGEVDGSIVDDMERNLADLS